MSDNENTKNEENLMENVKEKAKNIDTWIPVLVIAVFGVIWFLVLFWIILILFLVQFAFKLLTGDTNEQIGQVSNGLTQYISQILLYITYQTPDRPFPLGSPFPSGGSSSRTTKKKTSKKSADSDKE
jgi:uncharacterized protein YqhQ